MNKIIKNIIVISLVIVVGSLMPYELSAQCKNDSNDPGKLSINGNKVLVNGYGNGVITASNNIPIKICEGEILTLQSTLAVNSSSFVGYWLTPYDAYNALSNPPSNTDPNIITGSYTTNTGSIQVKMISKSIDPNGFSFYAGAGKYVITQYQQAISTSGSTITTHTCQVIEIIAPQKPVATVAACTGSEFQITLPANAANSFDDYEIQFNATVGNYNPILKTGKPSNYPFTIKSGTTLPDNQDRNITIRGLSATGSCPAPKNDLGKFSVNGAVMYTPTVGAIVGTTKKGEFKLAVSQQSGFSRNIYMRESSAFYNYSSVFKPYVSSATVSFDSTVLQVPNGDKQYCFRVEAVDNACATSANLLSADEICTTPTKVTADNNKNVIEWLPAATGLIGGGVFKFYKVSRLNSNGTIDKVFPSITNIAELKLEDNTVMCGQDYTYRVETNYGQQSLSQIITVRATSHEVLSKIPRFLATMTNDSKNVNVQGQFDPSNIPNNIKLDNYKFYRANSINGSYSLQYTGNSIFKDLNTDVEAQSYCYYMTWTNLCDIESEPSEKICTVNLKASGVNVYWTKEPSISVGIDSYIVQQVNPNDGTNIKELASNLKNIYSYNTQALPDAEGQEIYVQIEARPIGWNIIGSNTLPSTLSNIIRVYRPALSLIPQIFTPNGDNVNDKFIVRGKFIKALKMTIYDRWGNAIFYDEAESYPNSAANQDENTVIGWDGTTNTGTKALEGSYVYKIEITDTIGQTIIKEGGLLLAY